jgi:peptidoglycan-associated lipoprotein
MKLTTSLTLLATLPVLLVACASKAPTAIEVISVQPNTPVVETAPPVLKAAPKYEIVLQKVAPAPAYIAPENALFNERSFYFAINSAKIKPESAAQMEFHGKFLAANPRVTITIEGSSDSRGESDFNFALGKKRATAVAKALKAFGVADSQMEIISLGRDQPKVAGNVESAWSKNRRVDLVYPAK